MDRLTTPTDPAALVGRWVRLRDHDCPEHPYLARDSRTPGNRTSNP